MYWRAFHGLLKAPCPSHQPITAASHLHRSNPGKASRVTKQSDAVPQLQPQLQFTIRQAVDSAELRAAAYLRAASFYMYPSDRSEFAARTHRRMKADAEWEALEAKVNGTDPAYKGVVVSCLVAVTDDLPHDPLSLAVAAETDRSCKLPAASGQPPQLVIGTLDINQGPVLPAEELRGQLPPGSAAQIGRAYLSNICVAGAARRRGVAANLVRHAAEQASGGGASHLYVHVVSTNGAAVGLYTQQCGFEVEAEESEAAARALNRPRRLLLHRALS